MEFMLLFLDRKGAQSGAPGENRKPAGVAELRQLANDLARQGKLVRGAPLGPEADGVRIRVRDGKAAITNGPFDQYAEAVAGFWIVEAASREEAIEIGRRAFETVEPRVEDRTGAVEVHPLKFRQAAAEPGKGTPYLLAFRMEPGLTDCDGSKLQEMIDFGHALEKQQKFVETAPLMNDPAPARIEARSGKTLVLDGPFAESKEAVGGYSVILVSSRAEALDIATRYPHARWGPVEMREMISHA